MHTFQRFLVALLALVWVVSAPAQSLWKTYLSYQDATKSIPIGNRLYVLASGGLFFYVEGEETAHTLSKTTGLNGTNIQFLAYNRDLQSMLIIYSDYNMDILQANDSVVNLPQYKVSNHAAKTIRSVNVSGKNAYLATDFGIVVVNMEYAEFSNSYDLGLAVQSATAVDGQLYAATKQGIWVGNERTNLLDKNNWKKCSSAAPKQLFAYQDDLYVLQTDGLFLWEDGSSQMQKIIAGNFKFCNSEGDTLLLGNTTELVLMGPDAKAIRQKAPATDMQWASLQGNTYYLSRGYAGTQSCTYSKDSAAYKCQAPIKIDSPIRNLTYYLDYAPDGKLLVGGGSLNYTNQFNPGTAMYYQNGTWCNFSEDSIAGLIGYDYHNVTSVAQDPADPKHHFVSAACGGLFEFQNGRFVRLYDCENSPISSILPTNTLKKYYTRTAGLTYDKEGNLWMLNNEVDTVLRVLKNDHKWTSFYIKQVAGYPTFDHILMDSRGLVWLTHRRTTNQGHHAGVVGIYTAGTLDNKRDDTYAFQSTFTNQDNTSYTFNFVNDICEDKDGCLWIATDQGPFVLREPETFFEKSTCFEQVKVPRNDGTNYADYLLNGVGINCIAIDGGNRKWFGTDGDGVYLVSADGLQTVQHFTSENSPLLSNVIFDIAVNGESGEVMIGTDQGLVSYLADATTPHASMSNSSLQVYPNPVRPEFEGNVRVTGFAFNSDVKVATTTGQVIYQGTSVGGTFSWNLRNKSGKRVGTGIYYVIGSDEAGNKGATAKVLVVK